MAKKKKQTGRAWTMERRKKYQDSTGADSNKRPAPGTLMQYWVPAYKRKDGTRVKGHYNDNPYYKGRSR